MCYSPDSDVRASRWVGYFPTNSRNHAFARCGKMPAGKLAIRRCDRPCATITDNSVGSD
jgi:hypothetical protein